MRYKRRRSNFWKIVNNYMRQGHSKGKAIYLTKKQFAQKKWSSKGKSTKRSIRFTRPNIFRNISIFKIIEFPLFLLGVMGVIFGVLDLLGFTQILFIGLPIFVLIAVIIAFGIIKFFYHKRDWGLVYHVLALTGLLILLVAIWLYNMVSSFFDIFKP